ncbi:MAG: competence/damage-inducible protein A [Lachnospiraceae bacterium]|nr:competence/damage-inducible protein A [Lachnospiraceae bacterium]
MTAELISVGTEILLGNIVNTNAAFLSEECAKLGLSCYYQTVVGDNEERICETLKLALSRSDIVIMGGGLGPTQDDLSKEVAAKVCGRKLFLDEKCKKSIEEYFAKKDTPIPDNNWKQAMIPEGSVILENPNGTAPGVIIEYGEKRVILLPGPPGELKPMFRDKVIPYLMKMLPGTIVSKIVKVCGIGESAVEEMIEDLIDAQSNPTIATYAKTGEVHLRVTASAKTEAAANKLIKPVVKELKNRFGTAVYSTEEHVTLEMATVDLLVANELTVSTVESCTGGLVAGRLINVPGVSDVFKSGFVTYSNKAKRKIVGVKKSSLEKFGAVSKQVAEEMAAGAHAINKADVVVATTGIAGPDGGTAEKPVGLVYIACYVCGTIAVKEFRFSGNRALIREKTVAASLCLMRECLLEYMSKNTFGKK